MDNASSDDLIKQACGLIAQWFAGKIRQSLDCTPLEASERFNYSLNGLFQPMANVYEQHVDPVEDNFLRELEVMPKKKKRDRSSKNHRHPFDRSDFPPEEVRACFYEEGGKLYHKKRTYWGIPAGTEAGSDDSDSSKQVCVMSGGKRYPRAHVIFCLHHGRWPTRKIYHKNRDKTDDRIENIIEATHAEICRSARCSIRNRMGIKGVHFDPESPNLPFSSSISRDGVDQSLGSFAKASECQQAYAKAAKELHGAFNPASKTIA